MCKIKNQNGFSLIEMMTALVIGAIMLGVVVPTIMTVLPTMRVNSCASSIANNMQWARMRAVSENNPYFIVFDTANSRYDIYDDDPCCGGAIVKTADISTGCTDIVFGFANVTIGPDSKTGASLTAAGFTLDTNLTPALPSLRFSTDGTLGEDGVVYLVPSGDTTWERVRAIQAFSLSGKTSILKCSGACSSAADWI